jgi:pimeloyl-ACP methyl ester carboxylesterase
MSSTSQKSFYGKDKTMSEQRPTVVLVHGAFADSASWNGVIERLQAQSFDVVAAGNPLRSLTGDAAYVRDVIAGIGKPVILVGHSYAGMVITQAAADNDAVIGLVYVCAFAPDHDENAFGLSMRFPGSTLGDALIAYPVSSGGNEFAIRQDLYHHQFAADLSPAETAPMSVTQRPATEAALSEGLPTQSPAWKTIPSWFVIGAQDRNIPAALQRFEAQRAGARGVVEIPTGSHASAVSNPDVVVKTILEAVQAVAAPAAV